MCALDRQALVSSLVRKSVESAAKPPVRDNDRVNGPASKVEPGRVAGVRND